MSNTEQHQTKLMVLDARAQKLATVTESAVDRETVAHVAVVAVGRERFGIPVENVVQVIKTPSLAPLPGLPAWMPGIVQVRGELLAVVDISRWFRVPTEADGRFVVILSREQRLLGLTVEAVHGFRTVYADDMALSLQDATAKTGRPFLGTTKDLLTLIDPSRLFENPEVLAFRRSEEPSRS